ncbi:hypothetical protein [Cohnella boryungensis]|uniref:Uncharacterized protein n=1 Tax=Cohnella boryungensis TaxID=768479 RepID=A0ABV8SJI7_9BACL
MPPKGHIANQTTSGPVSTGQGRSSSGLRAASGASAQRSQELDKLRWLQMTVGNQAIMQMMAQSMAKAPMKGKAGSHRAKTPTANANPVANPAAGQTANPTTAPATTSTANTAVNTPQPTGLGLMRLKVNEARDAGGFGQAEAYKEESSAPDNVGDTAEMANTGIGGQTDTYQGASDDLKDQIKDGSEQGSDVSSQKVEKAKIDRQNQKLGVASGLLEVGSGFVGLINMKKAIEESNSKAKTAGALYEGLESTQKSFSGVAKVVDNAAKLDGHDKGTGASEAVAGYSGSVGDALSSIKSAFFMVKSVYGLFKESFSDEGIAKDDAIKGGLEALHNGLEAAQSAVKTVKSILEILESGVGKLTEAIPGIGIAISGVKITIKVFDMMQWHASKQKMTTIKRDFKTKYANSDMVKKNSYTLFGRVIHESQGTDKAKIDDRRKALMDVMDASNSSSTEAEKQEAQSELDHIQNYELAKEMKSINQKRLTRAGIEAGLEMANLAGDIATLSGAGSAVGISLKAAASGTKAGMGLFRRIKQYGRDKAAKSGEDSVWSSLFDADKSSDKKHAKRAKDADLILDMVAKLPERDDTDEAINQYRRVLNFIEATGCSTKALFKLNGDIDKQRELLMESMKQRD